MSGVSSIFKRLFVALAAAACLLASDSPARGLESQQPPAATHNVLCTIVPIYAIAANVAAEVPGVRLELLLEPDVGCPHDYQLRVSDRKKLAAAQLVLMNGLGLERFLDALRKGAGARFVELGAACEPIVAGGHACADPTHDHDHEPAAPNPHAWTSPAQAVRMVRAVCEEFVRLDPANKDRYTANADAYVQRLSAVADEYKAAAGRFKARKIVTQHNVFDYIARDLALEVVATLESAEQHEPSPRELETHIRTIRESGAAAIFAERGRSPRLPQRIADKTGVKLYTLDPLTTADKWPPPRDFCEQAMRANLRTLVTALGGT
jgi:ABC-type Zn uptake system ZnuABC Zn-binding protein ZnuA